MNIADFVQDETTIAHVWSFSNDFQEVPYIISRHGSSKSNGGQGVIWKCSCPSFTKRGGKTCKHLILLKEQAKSGAILADRRFNLTEFGIKVLNLQPTI